MNWHCNKWGVCYDNVRCVLWCYDNMRCVLWQHEVCVVTMWGVCCDNVMWLCRWASRRVSWSWVTVSPPRRVNSLAHSTAYEAHRRSRTCLSSQRRTKRKLTTGTDRWEQHASESSQVKPVSVFIVILIFYTFCIYQCLTIEGSVILYGEWK